MQLLEGDVTELDVPEVGNGFQLLLDFGCFHDELTDGQRKDEGREATAGCVRRAGPRFYRLRRE